MVKVINAPVKLNCEHLLGTFLDHSHYDLLVDFDCDFYAPISSLDGGNGEHNILFKFRKGAFTAEEQKGAYEGLIDAAGESQNRGLAAGPKGTKLQNRDWVTEWQQDVLDAMIDPVTALDGSDRASVLISMKDGYSDSSTRGNVWLRSKVAARFGSYEGLSLIHI